MVATTLGGEWDGIPIGTEVYTADGVHLGAVVDGDAWELVVEEGWFLVRDHQVRLSDVAGFEDGKLVLAITKAEVEAQQPQR
jgi:hypothetical protein